MWSESLIGRINFSNFILSTRVRSEAVTIFTIVKNYYTRLIRVKDCEDQFLRQIIKHYWWKNFFKVFYKFCILIEWKNK